MLSVVLTRRLGDRVKLPPLDYDSWILGHVIYRPEPGRAVSEQNEELTIAVPDEDCREMKADRTRGDPHSKSSKS